MVAFLVSFGGLLAVAVILGCIGQGFHHGVLTRLVEVRGRPREPDADHVPDSLRARVAAIDLTPRPIPALAYLPSRCSTGIDALVTQHFLKDHVVMSGALSGLPEPELEPWTADQPRVVAEPLTAEHHLGLTPAKIEDQARALLESLEPNELAESP